MPDKTAELAGLITDAMNHTVSKKTREYDTTAIVSRIETKEDGSKQTWVSIPGGVIETPVRAGVSLKPGDEVQVHVGGGRAFIQGNYTSPPTDDTRANQAYGLASDALDSAVIAKNAADSAVESAEIAKEAADEADRQAQLAQGRANDAYTYAGQAKGAADSAQDSADKALVDLSLVENVVGTVEWIRDNGTFRHTKDTTLDTTKTYYNVINAVYQEAEGSTIDESKDYYTRSGSGTPEDPYIYTFVPNPEASQISNYYNLASGTYTQVQTPVAQDISKYYELDDITNSVQSFINAHLELVQDGLILKTPEASGFLKIRSGQDASVQGVEIYSEANKLVAKYGVNTVIGPESAYHLEVTSDKISFVNGKGASRQEMAYISKEQLYIPKAVVVDALQVGDPDPLARGAAWKWYLDDSNNMGLYYIGAVPGESE